MSVAFRRIAAQRLKRHFDGTGTTQGVIKAAQSLLTLMGDCHAC